MKEMDWNQAWKTLPDKDGIYLCQIDEHYAILEFRNGHFQPNDWGDFVGVNSESSYIGSKECVIFWQNLPKLGNLTYEDKNELKKLSRKRGKEERKIRREQMNDKRYGKALTKIA